MTLRKTTPNIIQQTLLKVHTPNQITNSFKHSHTDFWSLHFNPVLGKHRIAENPSLDSSSYEDIRPESASSPVISDK